MEKVGIVTDTVACLSPETISQYGIKLVPVFLNIDGHEYRDRIDLQPEDFWRMYPDMKEFATAAPSMAEFIHIFEELSQLTSSIAGVFVSRQLSATYEAALQARELFLKDHPQIKIELVDSRIAAGAQGFVALEMGRAAMEGKNLPEVIAAAREMIPRVKYMTILESLNRLSKIGRAPKTAYMGELFQVKPIIGSLNNTGVVENVGRARGMDKAIVKMFEIMNEHVPSGTPLHAFVHYTNSLEEGQKLREQLESRFNIAEIYFTPYSPVICGAIGPAISVAFYC